MSFRLGNMFNRTQTRTQGSSSSSPVDASSLKPRQFNRHPSVASDIRDMGQSARDGGASSSQMRIANADVDQYAFSYKTGKPKVAVVNKPPKDGSMKLDMTMVVNVSGHDQGRDPTSAERYAKSNTYSVRVTYPDGKSETIRNIPRNDPSQAEYATAIDLTVDLQKGKTIIEAWPDGSAGVGGYVEGRRYEMFFQEDPGKTLQETGDRRPYREY